MGAGRELGAIHPTTEGKKGSLLAGMHQDKMDGGGRSWSNLCRSCRGYGSREAGLSALKFLLFL